MLQLQHVRGGKEEDGGDAGVRAPLAGESEGESLEGSRGTG